MAGNFLTRCLVHASLSQWDIFKGKFQPLLCAERLLSSILLNLKIKGDRQTAQPCRRVSHLNQVRPEWMPLLSSSHLEGSQHDLQNSNQILIHTFTGLFPLLFLLRLLSLFHSHFTKVYPFYFSLFFFFFFLFFLLLLTWPYSSIEEPTVTNFVKSVGPKRGFLLSSKSCSLHLCSGIFRSGFQPAGISSYMFQPALPRWPSASFTRTPKNKATSQAHLNLQCIFATARSRSVPCCPCPRSGHLELFMIHLQNTTKIQVCTYSVYRIFCKKPVKRSYILFSLAFVSALLAESSNCQGHNRLCSYLWLIDMIFPEW